VVLGGFSEAAGRSPMPIGKAPRIIREVEPPALLVCGRRATLHRILLLLGGLRYNRHSIDLAGEIARAASAHVTLFHVLPGPPAVFADLIRLEEDVDLLLRSKSRLGTDLRNARETLDRLGADCTVKIRQGDLVDEVFKEIRLGDYDLVVTGSRPDAGAFQTYILGDVAMEIVDGADRPVLIARAEPEERLSLLGSVARFLSGLLPALGRKKGPGGDRPTGAA